jgi:hypothetical protein
LIVNSAVYVPVVNALSCLIAHHVYPSLHHENVYPVNGTACTVVQLVLYATTCTDVPLIVPHVLHVYVSVYEFIVNSAVYVPVVNALSCLIAHHVYPSLHHENVYPVNGTACTVVQLVLYATTCTDVHEIVPPVEPVYVSVYELILNSAVYVPVVNALSCLIAHHVYPSLHHENVYPVNGIACTVVQLVLYATTCTEVPLIVPHVLHVYVNV